MAVAACRVFPAALFLCLLRINFAATTDDQLAVQLRAGSPSFRLGKRTADDVTRRAGSPSFRLGKRSWSSWTDTSPESLDSYLLAQFSYGDGDSSNWQQGLLSSDRLVSSSYDDPSFQLEKRKPTFRLGKRKPTFRLGKKAGSPSFRLGKRDLSSRLAERPLESNLAAVGDEVLNDDPHYTRYVDLLYQQSPSLVVDKRVGSPSFRLGKRSSSATTSHNSLQ